MTLFILYRVNFDSTYATVLRQYVRIPHQAREWNKCFWVLKSALFDCLPGALKSEMPGSSAEFYDALSKILQPVHKGLLRWDLGNDMRSRRTTWVFPAPNGTSADNVGVFFRERAMSHAEHFLCLPWTDSNASLSDTVYDNMPWCDSDKCDWLFWSLRDVVQHHPHDVELEDPGDESAYHSDTLDLAYMYKYCRDVWRHLQPLVGSHGGHLWGIDAVHNPLGYQPLPAGTLQPFLYTTRDAPFWGKSLQALWVWLVEHNTPEWRARISPVYPPPPLSRKQANPPTCGFCAQHFPNKAQGHRMSNCPHKCKLCTSKGGRHGGIICHVIDTDCLFGQRGRF